MTFCRHYKQQGGERQDVIQCLNEQRQSSEMCDVILVVGEERLPAHRCVLSASSHYFRSMFAQGSFVESTSAEVQLFSIDSRGLASILDLIYLGTLKLDLSNAYMVLEAADLMLMETVKNYCADFFTEILGSKLDLALANVLYIDQAARMYSMQAVVQRCERFVAVSFPMIVQTEAFTTLTLLALKHYIISDNIQLDDEDIFLNAAVLWILNKESERMQYADEIMSLVRFPLMSVEKLLKIQTHPLLKSTHCQSVVQEALLYHLQPLSQCSLQSLRTKPRIKSNEQRTVIYCMSGVTDFRCYLPAFDCWYSLQAPHDWPDDLVGQLSSRLHSRLVTVGGFVYACIVEKTPQEVGNCTVRAILQYDINKNVWKRCQLPSGSAGGQCRFLEAHNILFACCRHRIECYRDANDTWETLLQVDITPCDFVVADDDCVHFFNLESGIVQSVIDLVNSQRKSSIQTQVMTPNRNKVLSVCKLSKNEVLLTMRTVMGFTRQIFHVKTHLWRKAKFARIPACMETFDPMDTWQIVFDQKSDRLYILAIKSGLSDLRKREETKFDAALPFYEVEVKPVDATWRRLSCLPEGLGRHPLQLCVSSGNASMTDEVDQHDANMKSLIAC